MNLYVQLITEEDIYVKMKIIKEDEPICVQLITEEDKCEDEGN